MIKHVNRAILHDYGKYNTKRVNGMTSELENFFSDAACKISASKFFFQKKDS